jgi:hypothetical protein
VSGGDDDDDDDDDEEEEEEEDNDDDDDDDDDDDPPRHHADTNSLVSDPDVSHYRVFMREHKGHPWTPFHRLQACRWGVRYCMMIHCMRHQDIGTVGLTDDDDRAAASRGSGVADNHLEGQHDQHPTKTFK